MKLKNILDNILQIGIFILIVAILLIPDTSQYSYKLLTMQFVTAILLLILSMQIYRDGIKFSFNILLFSIFLYFSVIIYSYFISDYKNISFLVLTKRLTYLSIFSIIVHTIQKDKLFKMINVWIISATFVAVYGIVQYLGFDFFNLYKDWYKGCYRIFSTIGNANFLAGFLIITFPFLISSYFRTKSILAKLLISISGILLLICLAVTFSRSGYLVFIITILSFVFLFIIREKKKRYLWLSIVLILVLILLSILFFYTNSSLKHKLYPMLTRKTARIYIWQGAVDMMKEKPLNGFGLGTFVVNLPDFRSDKLLDFHPQNVAYIKHAHNYFMETWIESGLLGVIAVLFLIFIFLLKGIKSIFKDNLTNLESFIKISAVSSLIGILCMNLINVNMHYPTEGMFFWILLGIVYILFFDKNCKKRKMSYGFRVVSSVLFVIMSLIILQSVWETLPYLKEKNRIVALKFLDLDINSNEKFEKRVSNREKSRLETNENYKTGNLHVKKDNWALAIEQFKQAIDRDKEMTSLYNNLAGAYFYNYMVEEAILNYEKGLRIGCKELILYNLSILYFKTGNMKKSISYVNKVLKLNPNNYRARYLTYLLSK